MSRIWCPSVSQNGPFISSREDELMAYKHSSGAACKEYGAAAANSGVTAAQLAASLPRNVSNKFSVAVVASKTNSSFWPTEPSLSPFVGYSETRKQEENTVTCFTGSLLPDPVGKVPRLALPADQIVSLLESVSRHEAEQKTYDFSSSLKSLTLLPSVAVRVSLEKLLEEVKSFSRLGDSIEELSVASTPTTSAPEFASFFTAFKKLRKLNLNACSLDNAGPALFEALRDREMTTVSVESNDIGAAEDAEDIVAALSEYVRNDKFLLNLNLAYCSLDAESAYSICEALSLSDTTLTPEDLPPRDPIEEVPLEEVVDRAAFLGGSDADEGDEEVDEEEDALEDEDDAGAGAAAGEGEDGDENEEEEGGEEDEDEEEDAEAEEDDEEGEESEARPKVDPKVARRFNRLFKALYRDERRAREETVRLYFAECDPVLQALQGIRDQRDKETADAIAAFCARRSGWTHLVQLVLRGNPLGDRGAEGVALLLRDEIPLEEEEVEEIDARLRGKLETLLADLQTERHKTLVEERRARRGLRQEHRRLQSLLPPKQSGGGGGTNAGADAEDEEEGEAEEDQYYDEAPEVVMTNVDDPPSERDDYDERDEDDEEGDEDDEGAGLEEDDGAVWSEEVDQWAIDVVPRKSGIQTLRYLDLSSCEVGNRGLRLIASALKAFPLEVLKLSNNRFTNKARQQQQQQQPTVPSGVAALAAAVEVTPALRELDVGFCQLDAQCVLALSAALRTNRTVTVLSLAGNSLDGAVAPSAADDEGPRRSCLCALLTDLLASSVAHLDLSHTAVGPNLWQAEAEALADLSTRLVTLLLNNAGLGGDHFFRWESALDEREVPLRVLQLARNAISAADDNTPWLGRLLARCGALEELVLDHNPQLDSFCLSIVLSQLPAAAPLTLLSLEQCGLADPTALPARLGAGLRTLRLGGVGGGAAEVAAWAAHLGQCATGLESLRLWSRGVNMEEHLGVFVRLVAACPRLLYLDLGVLLRFDNAQDLDDGLGEIERELVARRCACLVDS